MHIRTNPKLNVMLKPLILFCEWLGEHHPILLAKLRYFARFKKCLNLKNPRTLNEKILYLSLKTDTSLWSRCADKYEVRSFVEEKGLKDILIPLIGVWDKVTDIDFNKLPNEFVLKAAHGSGDILVVSDKSKINVPEVVRTFQKDLSHRYDAIESGHHYIRIVPRMIAEELIHNDEATQRLSFSLIDYKLWCFNGKCHYIWVCTNRDEHSTEVMTYDRAWNSHPEYSILRDRYRCGALLPKPENLDRMIEVAEKLSEDFPCVRVDLYNTGGKIYLGELAFTSYGGLMDFYTDEFQKLAGSKIDLSNAAITRFADYRLYKGAWIWNGQAHMEKYLDVMSCKSMLNRGGGLVRNVFDFDTEKTEFWYLIKDDFGGLSDIPSKYRGIVRKALERFDIRLVTKEFLLENGYDVYVKAASNYKVHYTPPTFGDFSSRLNECNINYDLWGCMDKETGKLVAFAINRIVGDFVDYQTMKFDPESMKKHHCSYGLIYEMNRYYLEEKKSRYVSDGTRSLTNHSNIQSFLEEKFKFRKAYCRVNITYKWWLKLAVIFLFPFRSHIPILSVRSLLNLEEINRTFKFVNKI